mmetsp:Transcript_86402/g.217538  ORF Transcript_86402/g.217538 Transcript_86402/m.217538 type:complete len:142 (-) Transcript_86402:112-537(-)
MMFGSGSPAYAPGSVHKFVLEFANGDESLLHVTAGSFSSISGDGFTGCEDTIAVFNKANQSEATWTAPAAGFGDVIFTVAFAPAFGPVYVDTLKVTEASIASLSITADLAQDVVATRSDAELVCQSARGCGGHHGGLAEDM